MANTLALMHCGPKTIAAGLLHDTVEDCEGITTDTIIELFGEEICNFGGCSYKNWCHQV